MLARRWNGLRAALIAVVRACVRACVLACVLACPPARTTYAREPIVLPIAWHVVHEADGAVVSEQFLSERLARANAPYGVAFAAVSSASLAPAHAALETKADRDALASAAVSGAINCFVVRSLRDVDDPAQMRRGVHWHAPGGAHFVILSSIAGLNVLAHELGHFLGNRTHSERAGNLMSYLPGPGLPVLDAAQQRKLERALRGYLARKELRAVVSSVPDRQQSELRSQGDGKARRTE